VAQFDGVNFLLNRELSTYTSSLSTWQMSVLRARTTAEAVQRASLAPHPGSLLRSVGQLYKSKEMLAKNTVEKHLDNLLKDVSSEDPNFPTILRGLQGHWPRLYRDLAMKRSNPPPSIGKSAP
jgi:hypothetical protein